MLVAPHFNGLLQPFSLMLGWEIYYFESAAMLITLILLGDYWKQQRKGKRPLL